MEKELEIEYKNQLTKAEYQNILQSEFINSAAHFNKIIQTNHYFDTQNKQLKKQKAALRIRVFQSKNELTFKVPNDDFLMETNFSLTKTEVDNILKRGSFSLEEYDKKIKELNLKNIDNTSTFVHFNTFKTIRYEKKDFANLLVLDQTTFQNNIVDYELEVEGENAKDAKKYFHSVLSDYSIPSRKSLAKIARAEQNK